MALQSKRPRYYEPASIEVGDLIRVVWVDRGIEHARTARVYRRMDVGASCAFFTAEGAEIFHWMVGDKRNIKVVMLESAPHEQESVLDIFEEPSHVA